MKSLLAALAATLVLSSSPVQAKSEDYNIPPQACQPMAGLLYEQMRAYGEKALREHQLSPQTQNSIDPRMAAMLVRFWEAAALSGRGATILQLAQEFEKQCVQEAGDVTKMFTDPKYFQEHVER